ncbi:hypothetical protein PPACK8108_LOCUS24562 [Phakopsora pachyrhizi]|uniref:Uncharacterized protein n=1 Tax=Phakopsora pachyrhizi TaxID=170000 RepID=A0AAV0BS88_PHAPC|nr:hypothetical protein PPACK8108_LOCUS24562 [Phakopsora pachyrhizi]
MKMTERTGRTFALRMLQTIKRDIYKDLRTVYSRRSLKLNPVGVGSIAWAHRSKKQPQPPQGVGKMEQEPKCGQFFNGNSLCPAGANRTATALKNLGFTSKRQSDQSCGDTFKVYRGVRHVGCPCNRARLKIHSHETEPCLLVVESYCGLNDPISPEQDSSY